VAWQDLDSAGHVNNANYQDYLDEGLRQFLGSLGWPTARLAREGIALAPRHVRIEYRQPALPDDHLEIAIWLSAVGPDDVLQHGTVNRLQDGELLARAAYRWGAVDPGSGTFQAFPAALLRDLPSRGRK
jgi:YbgC/YbaW family acyl-CoA thioester hydrolase